MNAHWCTEPQIVVCSMGLDFGVNFPDNRPLMSSIELSISKNLLANLDSKFSEKKKSTGHCQQNSLRKVANTARITNRIIIARDRNDR